MLHELDKVFPTIVSFHLRDMYLRKNLIHNDTNAANIEAFSHLNNPYLHQYLLSLIANGIEPELLKNYLIGLAEKEQKGFMKAIIQYGLVKAGKS